MTYSKLGVVFVEIKEITPVILDEFTEFLRKNMITPVARPVNGTDSKTAYFSGCFTTITAKQIEVWLQNKGIRMVKAGTGE